MSVTAAIVLAWMNRLEPVATRKVKTPFPAVAAAIVHASNGDPDPLDAAAHLVSIGFHESGFYVDAISRADDPTWAYGPWQLSEIWLPPLPISLEWQATKALALIRESEARCGDLTRYASGHCGGAPQVAGLRTHLVQRLLRADFPGVFLEPRLPSAPPAEHLAWMTPLAIPFNPRAEARP